MASSKLEEQRTLCAHLDDIIVADDLDTKRATNSRLKYSLVIYVDENEVLKSKKWALDSSPRFQEVPRFCLVTSLFRPMSTIKFAIFREHTLSFRKSDLLGQFTEKVVELLESDMDLELKDKTGTPILAHIKIKVSLIADFAKAVMQSVDASLPRLNENKQLATVSAGVAVAASSASTGYDAVQTLGTYITPLGQALQLIVKIMDNVADAHPILKVSWIVLSSVYNAIQQQKLQDDTIRNLAETLREMVGAASDCPDLRKIEGTTDVIPGISRASLQVASLIDEYTKSPSLWIRALKSQFNDLRSRIEQCQQLCDRLMKMFDRRVILDVNKQAGDIKINLQVAEDNRQSDKIYQWLAAPDPSRNYQAAREKHESTTGSWFITGVQFAEWKAKADVLLWVHGASGCGKTILCSTIIEEIIHHCEGMGSPSTYAYFFFDSRDSQADLQLHRKLICSLIRQLSGRFGSCPDVLVKLYGDGLQQPSIRALEDTLQQIVDGFHDVYIIIDALDECTEREKLLKWITKIASWKSGKLHMLTTSRHEQDITNAIQSLSYSPVVVEGKSVADDMERYISQIFSTSDKWKPWEKVWDEIKVALMRAAGDMFRLVAFQLAELQDCYTLPDLRERLKHLPKDLDAMYSQVVSKIRDENCVHALKILQWLAFSARPLQLEELAEVVAVDFSSEQKPHFDPDQRFPSPQFAVDVCSGLVTRSEGQVKLAHMSVKDYLLSEHSDTRSGFNISKGLSHSIIAQTCLAYLLQFNTLEAINSRMIIETPLASYAAQYWTFHVNSVDGNCTDALQKLIVNILDPECISFIAWIRLWDPDHPDRPWNTLDQIWPVKRIAPPLYYASLTGLQQATQVLLERGVDVNAEGGHYGNALQAAVYNGHKEIVKLLLEKDADVNAQGGNYSNALQAAASAGQKGIVELLLEKGANVNAQRGHWGNALQAAAFKGHEGIVKLLLEKGADINAQGGYFGNALQAAASHGQEEIVQLLLKKGAGVNTQGGHFDNALLVAAYEGHERMVKLLLAKGATVNAQGGQYGNALQAAVLRGHKGIVKLLLENGADVNVQGGDYGNALQAAISERHEEIVKLLLDKGAEVSASGGEYGNALQAAASQGHEVIVELLLERGAEVNAQGGYYSNALQAAASQGHKVIVELLLAKGADVNDQGGDYGNALQAAASVGHEGIVKLLLKKGAEVNAHGGHYGNALQAAACGPWEGVVKLLLEKGADVNAQGGDYGNALHAAAYEGQKGIVKLLLEKSADVNAQGGDCGNALQAATSQGHEVIVELLLESGAEANAQGGRYGNALQAAAYGGHERVVKLLLEKGAHVNAQGGDYGNALHAAAFQGQKEVVNLLLDNGADVNAQGRYQNVLQAAASHGHEEIVMLLLEKGADIDAQKGNFGNALQVAANEGHEVIVKQLLEKGADVNAQGGIYGNALLATALKGHERIVKLLLEKGAVVNTKGGVYGHALQAAASQGHVGIAKLLLDRGANVKAQGGNYGNPLQAAAYAGHERMVKLLLEKDADINAQGGRYGNALQAAAYGGHEGMVKLLLAKGADAKVQGGHYGNALQAATSQGHQVIVQLLLEM